MDIARRWEERALPVEEAEQVGWALTRPLGHLIRGIETNASAEEMLNLLNEVVSAYLVSFE